MSFSTAAAPYTYVCTMYVTNVPVHWTIFIFSISYIYMNEILEYDFGCVREHCIQIMLSRAIRWMNTSFMQETFADLGIILKLIWISMWVQSMFYVNIFGEFFDKCQHFTNLVHRFMCYVLRKIDNIYFLHELRIMKKQRIMTFIYDIHRFIQYSVLNCWVTNKQIWTECSFSIATNDWI